MVTNLCQYFPQQENHSWNQEDKGKQKKSKKNNKKGQNFGKEGKTFEEETFPLGVRNGCIKSVDGAGHSLR